MTRASIALWAGLALWPIALTAQDSLAREPLARDPLAELRAGARVRVRAPEALPRPVVAEVVTVDGDSLRLRDVKRGTPVTLPRDALASVERSVGRDRSAGARRGALIGLAAGLGLGLLCVAVCPTRPGDANLAPVGGLIYGPAVGAGVGALVGPERWRVLALPGRGGGGRRGP